jgi:hypothetical protein
MITRVWITIDSEPSIKAENGCFDHCVNGVWPARDLDLWIAKGAAERTSGGYRFLKGCGRALHKIYERRQPSSREQLSHAEVEQRVLTATAGLPLIFSVLRKYGASSTALLDIAQLYRFGENSFREACELIELSGNDLQLHFHGDAIYIDWYAAHGLSPNSSHMEERSLGELLPVFETVASDFNRFASKPPIAYRAGAYKISDNVLDALRHIGIRIDSSYDILNKKEHVNLDPNKLMGNFPLEYRGLLEVPITAYVGANNSRVHRFAPGQRSDERISVLRRMNASGHPLVTYVLHSNSLMKAVGTEDMARLALLGPDEERIAAFSKDLQFIAEDRNFAFVNSAEELLSLKHELVGQPAATREILRI